jgi:hypothetical protein
MRKWEGVLVPEELLVYWRKRDYNSEVACFWFIKEYKKLKIISKSSIHILRRVDE